MESILNVEKVTKSFPGVVALNGVDFDLLPGEVHVIIGENGAGKSTLIKLLSGVYPKDSGRFLVDGKEVDIGSVHKAQTLGISTIYQEFNLVPELTVAQNIFLGREPMKKGTLGLVVDKNLMEKQFSMGLELGLGIDILLNKDKNFSFYSEGAWRLFHHLADKLSKKDFFNGVGLSIGIRFFY